MCNQLSMLNFSNKQIFNETPYYTHYAYDILETLFESEKLLKVNVGFKYNDGNIRSQMIKWIQHYSKKYNFFLSTVHLAILFLDIYMDAYVLSEKADHLKFLALIILFLAAKSNETDEQIPSIKELLQLVDLKDQINIDFDALHNYEPAQVKLAFKQYAKLYASLEYIILEAINFSTVKPTVASFIEIFQIIAVTENDLTDIEASNAERMIESFGDLKFHSDDYLNTISQIILLSKEFYEFLPSKIAAAIIATTRKFLGIKTFWNTQLELLTATTIEQIQPIICVLLDKQELIEEFASALKIEKAEDEVVDDSGFQDGDYVVKTSSSCSDSDQSIIHEEAFHTNKKFKI